MKMLERIIIVVVICTAIISASAWWFTRGEQAPSFELGENAIERSIEIEAEGEILHYQENSVWSENKFSEIMENPDKFRSDQIEQFNERLSTANGTKYAGNFDFGFDNAKKMTTVNCDVHGAMMSENYLTFKWLLYPLGLDFIEDDFEESTSGLSWKGTISGTQTSIKIELPPRGSVYEAWHQPNGHCHAHVWWGPAIGVEKTRVEIKTEAVGEIIRYQEETFYSESNFATISKNKDESGSQLIENFKEEIIDVTAKNCSVDLDESRRSVILRCDVEGATYDTNKYNMHFLLGNWPFCLHQFEEYEKKLVYEGKINGIPAKIVFEFPYKLSHCCEHVWPE